MNTVYRLVWSAAVSQWVPASELTRSRKKMGRSLLLLGLVLGGGEAQAGEDAGFADVEGREVEVENYRRRRVLDVENPFVIGFPQATDITQAVVIGKEAKSGGYLANVAVGWLSLASGTNATAVGSHSVAKVAGASAFGYGAVGGEYGVSLGYNASSYKDNVALGAFSDAEARFSVALGSNSKAEADYSVSVGSSTMKRRVMNLAPGQEASDAVTVSQLSTTNDRVAQLVDQSKYVSVGPGVTVAAKASGAGSTAVGNGATANVGATAVGDNAISTNGSVAVGKSSRTTYGDSIAIGNQAGAFSGNNTIAVGAHSSASYTGAMAVGADSRAMQTQALALGSASTAGAAGSVAIGYSATSGHNDSVALGSRSSTTAVNTVSVGNASTKRRIMNVGAGVENSDAVTVAQLKVGEGIVAGHTATLANHGKTLTEHSALLVAQGALTAGHTSTLDAHGKTLVSQGSSLASQEKLTSGHTATLDAHGNTLAEHTSSLATQQKVTAGHTTALEQHGKTLESQGASLSVQGQEIDRHTTSLVTQGRELSDQGATLVAQAKLTEEHSGTLSAHTSGLAEQVVQVASHEKMLAGHGTQIDGLIAASVNGRYIALDQPAEEAAVANGTGAIALGGAARADADGTVAIGTASSASGTLSVSVGARAEALGAYGVALGDGAFVGSSGDRAVALGSGSMASLADTVSIGNGNVGFYRRLVNVANGQAGNDAVNVLQLRAVDNRLTTIINKNTYAIGQLELSQRDLAYVFSHRPDKSQVSAAAAADDGSLAVGAGSKAAGIEDGIAAVAVGLGSEAGAGAIAIGASSSALKSATAIGGGAAANNYGVAVGQSAEAGITSIAIGQNASALGNAAIGIGFYSEASGVQAFALGTNARAVAARTVSVGTDSIAAEDDAVAIGFSAKATHQDSIAIGALSSTGASETVSVGNAFLKRRITNIAEGTDDNDAVVVSQLKGSSLMDAEGNLLSALTYNVDRSEVRLGGVSGTRLVNVADGVVAAGSRDAVNGGQLASLGSRFDARMSESDLRLGAIEESAEPKNYGERGINGAYPRSIDSIVIGSGATALGDNAVAIGSEAHVDASDSVALGSRSRASEAMTASFGDAEHGLTRRLVNVADGQSDGDAATVRQLGQVDSRASSGIGANAEAIAGVSSRENAFDRVFSHQSGAVVVDAANADSGGSLAIGIGSRAMQSEDGGLSVAVGQQSWAGGDGAALGATSKAGMKGVAVGSLAQAQNYGTALGYETLSGLASVAIGWQAHAAGETSVAIGFDAQTTGTQAFALGTHAQALANAATALGSQATAKGTEGVALGFNTRAGQYRSVALGSLSETVDAYTVSVGNRDLKRRIVNVEDGIADNDVVTVGQLKSSSLWDDDGKALTALTYSSNRAEVILSGLNGSRLMNVADGIIAPGSRDAINGGQLDTLRDGLDKRISGLDNRVGTLEGETLATSEAPEGARTLSESSNTATPPAASSAEVAPIASADDVATTSPAAPTAERLTPSRIENVLTGEAPTDAVNLTQLNAQRDEAIKAANIYTDERVESISQDMTSLRNDVQSRFQQVDRRIDRMAAMSGAYAGMAMNTAGLDGVHRMGVGVGSQRGQKAIAVGYQHVIGKRASFSIGGASGGSDRSVNAGAGFSW